MIFSRFFCAALVVCGSLGLFLGTANPFFHVPGAVLVYPACLLLASRGRHPFRLGWCVGIPGAAGALYWIAVAAHMYGGFPWLLAAPCSILLGMYVALWGGLFCFCASRLLGLPAWKRSLALGLLWFLLEWTRGWFCTGFSWLTLSSGLAAWPVLMQPLSVLGEYGYSGLLAAVTFLLCEGVLCRRENRRDGVRLLASGACIAAAVVVFGAWRMQALPEKLAAEGVPVACTMVQGSVRQDVKWSPEYQRQTLEHYIRLSVDGVRAAMNGLAGTGRGPGREEIASSLGQPLGSRPDAALAPALPDFILWPETAMPFAYPASPLSRELNAFADGLGIPLLFGAPGVERRIGGATALFNRAFMLSPEGNAVHYDKEHLVPFGEYLPPVLDWKIFESLLQGLGGFTAGGGDRLFPLELKGRGRVDMGMLICYEAIFPELSRKRVAGGAQLLLNISNDAWYDYTSAPMQHLQLSLMRAVEQGRYVLRATNSGITAVLDPLGGVHAMGSASDGYALFLAGSLTGTALALRGHTPYFYLHPWLPALALALLAGLSLPALCAGRGEKRRGR